MEINTLTSHFPQAHELCDKAEAVDCSIPAALKAKVRGVVLPLPMRAARCISYGTPQLLLLVQRGNNLGVP